MTIESLQSTFAATKQSLADFEADLNTKRNRLKQLRETLTSLSHACDIKKTALLHAFDTQEVEKSKSELEIALNERDNCETAIKNLSAFINNSSPSEIIKELGEIKKEILLLRYNEILAQLGNLPDEQLKLLKDFIVINRRVDGNHIFRGYQIGSAYQALHGDLRGKDFTLHENLLEQELGIES